MRWAFIGLGACSLMAVGYFMGTHGIGHPRPLQAQDQFGPTEETVTKVQESLESLKTAMNQLSSEQLYQPATSGINAFAITVGGVDAIGDLESGRGVDPETYAGLYAGLATEEVAEHLATNENGQLTYKDKVIRMYPISRLKKVFEARMALAGQGSSTFPTSDN
ncbi:MAG: hypothetical protein O2955_10850 [Planctomycetota bacterium]|nr:hypothetical protein [Planctomycetota bacterium]MDA1213010.1 hypothetical protein [Planctomycetota bacterium]